MIYYKYFAPTANSFKALSVLGLWCHYPNKMNDPFECLGAVERTFSREALLAFRKHIENYLNDDFFKKLFMVDDGQLTRFINDHRKKQIKNFAFCALAEEYDDILMWSHYAAGHTGFVVGLEFPELEDNNHHFRKVQYVSEMPQLDLVKWADSLQKNSTTIHYLLDDISLKSSVWSYEKEWRIWRKEPGYYRLKPEQVKSVYCGISCEPDVKAVIGRLFHFVDKDFIFYEMEFDDAKLKLKY